MSCKHTLEQLINVSKDVFKTCSLTDAFLEFSNDKRLIVNTSWSQLDIEKNDRTKFQKSFLFDLNEDKKPSLFHVTKLQPIRNDLWSVRSPNSLLNAIVTSWKDGSEDNQFIEIWDKETRISNVNLTKLDKHSKVYEPSTCLGSFVWSPDSKKIAYVAEIKKKAKEKNFYNSKLKAKVLNEESSASNKEDDCINEDNYQEKYSNFHVDDWGEQYVGKSQSILAIYDLESNEVKVLENLPKNYVPAQLTWYKNEGLVFCAYVAEPYKLGLVYCPIRTSELFYYDLGKSAYIQLTDYKNENLRDPRFSNDFETLCWLQNQARGPHFQCSKLVLMEWSSKKTSILVDIVKEIKDDNESEFNGIFAVKFPQNCWSLDNKRIIIHSGCKRANRIFVVDVETKKIKALSNKIDKLYSCDILRFTNDWILAQVQSYNKKPSLILGQLPKRGEEQSFEWTFTQQSEENLRAIADVKLLKFHPNIKDQQYPNLFFEAILVEPKQRNDTLIVFPHGGPHSCYGCEYSGHVAILYKLGYSVLMINYRGSSSYGQDTVDSLPGKIGENDVNDCQQAAEYCMKEFKFKQATLYGGSHGGFLTTQLIGQFPDFYKAAAARNPVTNLETMLSLTDIPDWVMCESFGEYDYDFQVFGKNVRSKEVLYQRSPISHIDRVKTPCLLMVGQVDLRVPPSQGIEYYKALKARNVPAKLATFKDDNHPLDKPQTFMDTIILTLLWYEKYLD